MKILVTGATGLIGRAIVELLMHRGDEVTALVRPDADPGSLKGQPLTIAYGDITDRGAVARAAKGVEAVIHTAAFVSLNSPRLEEMRRVNATGVEHVASAAREVGATRFVHVSSIVAVGASPDKKPVNEGFPWPFKDSSVPYLVTKHEAEQIAFRYNRGGLDVVVVNPCLVVGAPDPRGNDPAGILKYLNGSLSVCIDGGANYVDVWDVARGTLQALMRGRAGERYILGGENLSFEQLYARLHQITGLPAPRLRLPNGLLYGVARGLERLGRFAGTSSPISPQVMWMAGHYWYADSTKAQQELGYRSIPIQQSLQEAVDYYRSQHMDAPHKNRDVGGGSPVGPFSPVPLRARMNL